jgi:antirestriction protein ArdC
VIYFIHELRGRGERKDIMAASKAEIKAAEKIIEILEGGNVLPPWKQGWKSLGNPRNLSSKIPYKGLNRWVLSMAPYADPRYVTYEQAKKLGGNVKKGEKGWSVSFWIFPDEAGKAQGKHPYCKGYTVFNVTQCEGLDLPELKKEEAPIDKIGACEEVVKGYKTAPPIKHEGDSAFYSPKKDEVTVPSMNLFHSSEEYYSVLFHELGHSTGHDSRLSRKGIVEFDRFGSAQYSKEELIAEFTASMLLDSCGIEGTLENSAAYIQGWVKALKDNPEILVEASRSAQKAFDYIVGKKEALTSDE